MVTFTDEAHHTDNIHNDSSMSEISVMNQEVGCTKKKKKVRKAKSHHSCQDLAGNISNDIVKYWTQRFRHVITIDIDPQKIDCAQHNATVYGVHDHIDFIRGDFIHVVPHLKGETAFMSPPWGGPDYAKVDVYDIKAMLKPCDGYSLFKFGTSIASRVVMFLPRNIDQGQLADVCLSVDPRELR